MSIPFWIAKRYFFTRKKRSFISWLSVLSMLGVGVGTMALVIVLSVFNGMEELNRSIFKTFEADLTITPTTGKRFTASPALWATMQKTPGMELITPVIQDNALARYSGRQTVVKVKGVDNSYLKRRQLDSVLVEGRFYLLRNGVNYAIVGDGVRRSLGVSPEDILTPLELWYPNAKPGQKTLNLMSENAFNQQYLNVSGVFFIEAQYDNYVIAPIGVIRELVGYGPDEISRVEIQLKNTVDEEEAKTTLQDVLGSTFLVQTRDDLNKDLFRAIRIEKLFVTLTLAFIILIASVNIFFSLSMLVIEKQENIKTLFAMGATRQLVRRIFMAEGVIVAMTGAITGLLLGLLVCYLQEQYGFVKFGTQQTVIDAYPVKIEWGDLAVTGIVVTIFTILTSWFPAQRAANIKFR
nr:ABC transporter permease [uncultured Arsenicibacter sp.]